MSTSWSDPESLEYHEKQWLETKQSTIDFYNFLEDEIRLCSNIIDIACGGGAVTYYFAKLNKKCNFTGIDNESDLILLANNQTTKLDLDNLTFKIEDMFDLIPRQNVDMVTCIATLSWVEAWETAIKEIGYKLNPKFIAVTSLFYEGLISAQCKIIEHSKEREVFYNTISIPKFQEICLNLGYRVTKIAPFVINFDIPKPAIPKMGTFTLRTLKNQDTGFESDFERIQVSGPILMNWYFILLERIT